MSARTEGEDLVLTGTAVGVAVAGQAAAVLVAARSADGDVRVALVPSDAEGVVVTPVAATAWGAAGNVTFVEVRVPADHVLGGVQVRDFAVQHLRLGLCGVQVGVCAAALGATASYVSHREQFGRPISTNQAVSVRAADAYLDTEAIQLTTWRAAWLLDEGRSEEAVSAVLVAKYWAARGGLRVVHATQHLHGGIGADIDYPIHRYFLWGRQNAFSLGGSDQVAAELGSVIDQAPAIGAPIG